MKFRIIIGAVIMMLTFGGMTAFATNEQPTVTVEDNQVYAVLSGTVDMAEFGLDNAQIKNRIPYTPLQLGISVSDPETKDILYTNQIQVGDDGSYNTKFILDVTEGTYNIKLSTAYCIIYDGAFEYRDGTVNGLNNIAKSGDVDELERYMNKYAKYMKLDLSVFNQYKANEKKIIKDFIIKTAPFATKAEISETMKEAVFSVGLKTDSLSGKEKTKMLDDYLEALGNDYTKISNFIIENAIEIPIINIYNSGDYKSVKDGIYELSLKAFVTNKVNNIYDLEVLFNDNLFSIPQDTMTKYQKCTQKTAFYTALNNRKKEITTLDKFHLIVSACLVEAAESVEPTKKPSSGGGGGGGSTTTYYGTGIAATAKPNPTAEPIQTETPNETDDEKFSDLKDYLWAEKAVNELAELGAIHGDGNGNFLPENNITREEYAQIIAWAFNLKRTETGDLQFDDVNENDWYYTSVMSCAENAVTVGISQTTFGVGQNITRQDAATMLSRVMSMTQKRTNSDTFADDNLIADYAKDSVYAMKDHGILSGYEDNTFRPVSLLSRAEAAKIIYEAIQLGGE